MTEHIIRTKGLKKSYKNVQAVRGIDLNVEKGDIYGFLGPNGAGKTTTIKMILDLVHPDAGEILINGKSTKTTGVLARQGIGYLPERAQFYQNLTAIQTMEFFAELKGVGKEECDELLAKVGMSQWRDEKVGTFSKGMVQLVGVAQALLGAPHILILDEPTSGLDPRWARALKDIMLEMNGRGTTVFFSSHLLSEVQELCKRVAILNKGQLVVEDTVSKVSRGLAGKPKLIIRVAGDAAPAAKALAEAGFMEFQVHGQVIFVFVESGRKSQVMKILAQANVEVEDFRTEESSLEDAFMKYIGADSTPGGDRNGA
ncbi:MAG: ABC transporter ATP-binding protein [Thermoplasmata archaeon]